MKNFLLLLTCFCAVQCSTPGSGNQKWTDDPVFAESRVCIDSCRVLLHDLQLKYESLGKVNEFESLKARNNHDMAQKNLLILEALLDSAATHPDAITDRDNYKIIVKSQCDYLMALYTSGKAIMGDHSQTFGKWKDKPPTR